MSYQCGIGPSLAVLLEVEPHDARFVCDTCGLVFNVVGRGRMGPPAWFFAGKPPPGWADERGLHVCPRCRKAAT